MNLTPQQLSAFLHLSRTGSFSEAALLQGVSQPSLSRTIQRIERVVGRRLFDRTTRHVTLTSTGDELRPIAERLVSEFAGAYSELTRFIQGVAAGSAHRRHSLAMVRVQGGPFIAMAPASSVRAMTDAACLKAGLALAPLNECAFLGTTGSLVPPVSE